MKALFILIGSLVSLFVALIPELVMCGLWGLINPTTELARIVVIGLFVLAGGSMCVLFGFLGFMLWVAVLKVGLE